MKTLLAVALLLTSLPASGTETLLASLNGLSNGYSSPSHLTAFNSSLFGTTPFGGPNNDGTVFELDPPYTSITTVYAFANAQSKPLGPVVIDASGSLYGTTASSSPGQGSIYELTKSGSVWTFITLAGFPGDNSLGGAPQGELAMATIAGHLSLVGTAYSGGTSSKGTLWSYDLVANNGVINVLHTFTGTGVDGANPLSGAVLSTSPSTPNLLYGTTVNGGASGMGTVFTYQSAPTAVFTTIYSFVGGTADGSHPQSIPFEENTNGALLGTTFDGGSSNAGVLWAIPIMLHDTHRYGAEYIVHHFLGYPNDGSGPSGFLVGGGPCIYPCELPPLLEGTAAGGGIGQNNGTTFKVYIHSGVWSYSSDYSFIGPTSDGKHPTTAVTKVGLNYYALTMFGGNGTGNGCNSQGCGAVVQTK